MPYMSSADAATDAASHLADTHANPAPAAPFARFGAQTMDAIRKIADIFAATGAPPNPTQPTMHTRATVKLPRQQHITNPQAPSRVPPAGPPSSPPRPPPYPPPRVGVEPPTRDPPHRYHLRVSADGTCGWIACGGLHPHPRWWVWGWSWWTAWRPCGWHPRRCLGVGNVLLPG